MRFQGPTPNEPIPTSETSFKYVYLPDLSWKLELVVQNAKL